MSDWKAWALAAVGADPRPRPEFSGKLPLCSTNDCPQYDGKRCRCTGFRPNNFCEPVLEAIADMAKTAWDAPEPRNEGHRSGSLPGRD